MHITVAILAYNEEKRITQTLDSLLKQSVFASPSGRESDDWRWELLIVPNGCTDSTAVTAKSFFSTRIDHRANRWVTARVETLVEKGKANAWNKAIHELSRPDTDAFVFIDADIEFGEFDTLRNAITRLLDVPESTVVVDQPLKSFEREPNPSLVARLSLMASRARREEPAAIAGSFYCARASLLRQIWMPIGLSVEDGFLAAMVLTDCFREGPDQRRIVRAQGASHYFEGLTKPGDIIDHEVRLVIGTILNCYLCWETLAFITDPHGAGAGALIRDLNERRPTWYREFMTNSIRSRGWWVIPTGMVFRRWHKGTQRMGLRYLRSLPWRALAFAFDLIVFAKANARLRAGSGIGYW